MVAGTGLEKAEDLLHRLAIETGDGKRSDWHNNNSTVAQRAYVIDLTDLQDPPAQIFQTLFKYNQQSQKPPLVAVPVAGWKTEEDGKAESCSCVSTSRRKERLVEVYAQSFTLSPMNSAKSADLILRIAKATQIMEVFKTEEDIFFRVSAGVRITDADAYLQKKGFALPPNMPTLHVASLVGAAANGCYGPARDYGPMTTNIVEMKVIDALGQPMTLSEKENTKIFRVLRDCHLGAGFYVSEITLKNIEPKFRMQRHHVQYLDVAEVKKEMLSENRLKEEHFVAMFIPVDILSTGEHNPRLRITTMNRTDKSPTKETKCRNLQDLSDYISLITTETGEPLIDSIVHHKDLRQFFPLVLKAAAEETWGNKKETFEIGWSANILHLLRTYTELPICDINWLIQVGSANEARDVLVELLEMTEKLLQDFAEKDQYPLLNAFSRYLKGIYYHEGEGGVTPTAIDKQDQSILSFEYITFTPLVDTMAFKTLVNGVIKFLKDKGLKFHYHPGKNWPEQVSTLPQIFADKVDKKKLRNFKDAIYLLHGGKDKIAFSPFLTPQKKEFIGFSSTTGKLLEKKASGEAAKETIVAESVSQIQKQHALQRLILLAQEKDNQEIAEKAKALLK